MSFSTNHLFIVGPELAVIRGHTGVDAGSGSPNGPGVHQHIPVVTSKTTEVMTEQTPANSVVSSTDSSFEDLIFELERVHLNSTSFQKCPHLTFFFFSGGR